MYKYLLKREECSDQGTFGSLDITGIQFHTAELPWRNNERSISCIPAGSYIVKPHVSPKFGECFALQDVPGRSNILIHVGNYAGDTSKGYRSDVEGCIIIGDGIAHDGKQQMITNSRKAFAEFSKLTGKKEFILDIN